MVFIVWRNTHRKLSLFNNSAVQILNRIASINNFALLDQSFNPLIFLKFKLGRNFKLLPYVKDLVVESLVLALKFRL